LHQIVYILILPLIVIISLCHSVFIEGPPLVLIIMLTKITVTQQSLLKTTLLFYHTTGFDCLNCHHQMYIFDTFMYFTIVTQNNINCRKKSLKLKNCLKLRTIIYFSMYERKQYYTKAVQRTYPFYVFCIKEMLGSFLTILVLCFMCFNVMSVHLIMTI
jgi:hypothetical protein